MTTGGLISVRRHAASPVTPVSFTHSPAMPDSPTAKDSGRSALSVVMLPPRSADLFREAGDAAGRRLFLMATRLVRRTAATAGAERGLGASFLIRSRDLPAAAATVESSGRVLSPPSR